MRQSLEFLFEFLLLYLGVDKFDRRDRVQAFNHNGRTIRTHIVLTGNGICVVLLEIKNDRKVRHLETFLSLLHTLK